MGDVPQIVPSAALDALERLFGRLDEIEAASAEARRRRALVVVRRLRSALCDIGVPRIISSSWVDVDDDGHLVFTPLDPKLAEDMVERFERRALDTSLRKW